MSEYSDQRLLSTGRLKGTACAFAAALSLVVGVGSAAFAQNATPGAATPAPACTAPALPPGTPTPKDATPAAHDMVMATPAASPAAGPAGTPANALAGTAIIAAATNIADCGNADNYDGLIALVTPNMLKQAFQTANPYDAIEVLKSNGGQHFGDFKASNAVTFDDGSAGVNVTYMQTKYQLTSERWTLVKSGDFWMLDSFTTVTPHTDLDTAVVGVELAGAKDDKTGKIVYTITPAKAAVALSPALDFHATNLKPGAENHELIIMQLPKGADVKGLFDGSVKQSDVTFFGQVTVPAGAEKDLLLVGLPAGDYVMACFVPGPDGAPHAMNGMTAKFTVNPAS